MNKQARNIALGIGLLGLANVASAFPDPFQINPAAIGMSEPAFDTTYIDFSYEATVDQGPGSGGVSSFSEDGVGFFGSFRHPTLGTIVTGTGLNSSYKLYLRFTGDGGTSANGAGGIDGSFGSFQVDVYADVGLDTDFQLPAIGGPDGDLTLAGTADDIHVATSTVLIDSAFHVFPGLAAGDFDVVVKMIAVDTGIDDGLFFGSPFNLAVTMHVDLNGVNTQLDGFAPPPLAFTDGTIVGSGNLSAMVPVPSILPLLGIGLFGLLGVSRFRKNA